jgi:hypothetical protein
MMIHITAFLTYQNPWPQEFVPPNSTLQRSVTCDIKTERLISRYGGAAAFNTFLTFHRLLGIAPIYSSSCGNGSDIRVIDFNSDLDLDHYLNPIALIICYVVVALTSVILLDPQVNCQCSSRLFSYVPKVLLGLNLVVQNANKKEFKICSKLSPILFVSLSLTHTIIATLIRNLKTFERNFTIKRNKLKA